MPKASVVGEGAPSEEADVEVPHTSPRSHNSSRLRRRPFEGGGAAAKKEPRTPAAIKASEQKQGRGVVLLETTLQPVDCLPKNRGAEDGPSPFGG